MPTKWKPGPGTLYFDGVAYEGVVTDYTFDSEEALDNVNSSTNCIMHIDHAEGSCEFTFKIPRIALLKVIGLWDMVLTLCPSPRVRHLMEHGSERTRYKNYKHACRLICKTIRRK